MKVLLKKFFFIIQFLLYYIKSSETIPLWKDESEVSYINGNRNSYSFDGETGAEIYLINGNLNYYSPTTQTEKTLKFPKILLMLTILLKLIQHFILVSIPRFLLGLTIQKLNIKIQTK